MIRSYVKVKEVVLGEKQLQSLAPSGKPVNKRGFTSSVDQKSDTMSTNSETLAPELRNSAHLFLENGSSVEQKKRVVFKFLSPKKDQDNTRKTFL